MTNIINPQESNISRMPDESDSERHQRYIKHIKAGLSALQLDNEKARRNKLFVYGDQWEGKTRERISDNKLTFQFNFLRPTIRSVTGEQSYNTPELQVRPLDDDVNQEEVNLIDDILRYTSYKSDMPLIQRICFKNQILGGRGALYCYTDYENEMSFDKVFRFATVEDASRIYYDPGASDAAKQKSKYQGIISALSTEEYKAVYGALPVQQLPMTEMFATGEECVFIASHFEKEFKPEEIVKTSKNEVMTLKEYRKMVSRIEDEFALRVKDNPDAMFPDIPVIIDKRIAPLYTIKHIILDGERIIDETEWPSSFMPIVNVPGDSEIIDGQERYFSFVEDVKDAQRLYNYAISEIGNSMANARREQFFATPENMEGFEDLYANPSNIQGGLPYNPDTKNGGSPPVPITAPAFNPSLLQASKEIKTDMQGILGRYEEGRGQESNAMAGIAITNRQLAENKSLEIYYANLNAAIQLVAQIGVSLIPSLYDGERTIMAMDSRKKTRPVRINRRKFGEQGTYTYENEIKKHKYDVAILPGPSYAIQKQLAMQQFKELMQLSNTPAFQLCGDEFARQLNLPNANEIADRLGAIVPPNVMAAGKGEPPPPPPPPTVQEKLAAMEIAAQAMHADADIKESHAKNVASAADVLKSTQSYQSTKAQSVAKTATALSDILKVANEAPAAEADMDIQIAQDIAKKQTELLQRNNELLTILISNSISNYSSPRA